MLDGCIFAVEIMMGRIVAVWNDVAKQLHFSYIELPEM